MTIQIGDRIELTTPTGLRRGHILSIQDAPRKLTGGRGIGIRFDDGTHGDGWDVDDVRVLTHGMPRKLHAGLVADIAEDCGCPRDIGAEALRIELESRCEAAQDDADRWAWIDGMRRSLAALMQVPVVG